MVTRRRLLVTSCSGAMSFPNRALLVWPGVFPFFRAPPSTVSFLRGRGLRPRNFFSLHGSLDFWCFYYKIG